MAEPEAPSGADHQLQREVRPRQFFSLAFGAIIGVAWVVVLGDWLALAGSLGAIIGITLGGLAMMLIGLCYGELVTALPVAGGEVVYAYEVFGFQASYLIGWFLALVYVVITAFEAISFAWVLDVLLPWSQGPVLYVVLGEPVSVGSLALGLGGMIFFTVLNYRGARSTVRLQDIMTVGLVGAAAIFFLAGIGWGDVSNLRPLFRSGPGRPASSGILWLFVTSAVWFSGFQVIPQLMEERAEETSLRRVGQVVVLAIGSAILFYCLVIVSSAMATPYETILDAELPVAASMEAAFGHPLLGRIVLVAALLGILTTWNAVFIMGARTLFALGRGRMVPGFLGEVHPVHRSPGAAVLVVGGVGTAFVFLGRQALVPFANIGATCLALAFVASCWGVLKLRKDRPDLKRGYRVPGGTLTAAAAILVSTFILAWSVYEPYAALGRVPLEWLLLVGWGVVGLLFWLLSTPIRSSIGEEERRRRVLGAFAGESVADSGMKATEGGPSETTPDRS